jgi:DNA polymerase-3 subunit epsilon
LSQISFIDFEASSLSRESYPIEVGVAKLDLETGGISSWGMLIRPSVGWMEWSIESQGIHNISPTMLHNYGESAMLVADTLNARLGTSRVYCDSPDYDGRWNQRLFYARGIAPTFKIGSIWEPLMGMSFDSGLSDAELQEWLTKTKAALNAPNPHRAVPDAELLATCFWEAKQSLN